MLKSVMKNNLLDFNNKLFQQTSGTTISIMSTPPYACIYMDRVEQDFWEIQELLPLLRFRLHGKKELKAYGEIY